MKKLSTATASALAITAMLAASTQADVLALTDFDGRTASGPTASDLNWTLDGLDDPGSITNDAANLFDNTTVTQNIFAPAVNTGNGDTFWQADVSITVAAGSTVTLEDVTLDYFAIDGGSNINVTRKSDFTLTLLNPSDGVIQAITIADAVSTKGPPIVTPTLTFDFTDVALSLPGTYTLRIKAGDFTGDNETGNHTGIDNLSINGTVIPEPSSLALLGLGGLLIARRRRA